MLEGIKSKKDTPQVHLLESYADDMVGVLSEDKGNTIQQIIHEQEEREDFKKRSSPYTGQNRLFLFISLFLVISSFGLFGYYYFFFDDGVVVNTVAPFKSLIINDNTVFIEAGGYDKDMVVNSINEQINKSQIKHRQLEGIYFADKQTVLGLSKFNTLIQSSLLQTKESPINENFLLGLIGFENSTNVLPNADGLNVGYENSLEVVPDPLRYKTELPVRKDVFILLSIRSFADVFPLMKQWEDKLFIDLYEIFGKSIRSDRKSLQTKDWQDGIVQNKNARILYDNKGDMVLAYVYIDDNHVMLTTNEESVREVIERLVASKVRK